MKKEEKEKKIIEGFREDGKYYNLEICGFLDNLKAKALDRQFDDIIPLINVLVNCCSGTNDLLEKIDEFSKKVTDKDYLTSEVKEECQQLKSELTMKKEDYFSICEHFLDLYNEKNTDIEISSLCPELDKRIGGLKAGTLSTICGGSGSMKTTYAINVALDAIKRGKNVVYISLEETPLQLFCKIASRMSVDIGKPIPVNKILLHNLDDKESNVLCKEILPYIKSLPGNLYLLGESDLPNYDTITFEKKLKEMDKLAQKESLEKCKQKKHGIDLLFVDHIQLLKFSSSSKDEMALMNMYVSFFRRQSLSFLHEDRQIAVVLLSQANRQGIDYAKRNNGVYLMQHIAEASEIERASTNIISVYTDPMNQISKLLKLGTIKLRNAALLVEPINVYANGELYQVGQTSTPEQAEYTAAAIGLGSGNNTNNPSSTPNLEELLSLNVDFGL